MSYTRDKDRHTRGIGAIAAVDSRDPRATRRQNLAQARRFVQRDRVMSALGAINEGGFSAYKAAHPVQGSAGSEPGVPDGQASTIGGMPRNPPQRWGSGNSGLPMPPIPGINRQVPGAGATTSTTKGSIFSGPIGITKQPKAPIVWPITVGHPGSTGTTVGGGGAPWNPGGGTIDPGYGVPVTDPGSTTPGDATDDPGDDATDLPGGLPAQVAGIDTKKLLIAGAVGLGAYLLFRKKS